MITFDIQVTLSLVHVRKPSLVPDSIKSARRGIVEEAAAMAAALSVHDALRRFLAYRHREEALAGRGPAARALLRRKPPRPPVPRNDSSKYVADWSEQYTPSGSVLPFGLEESESEELACEITNNIMGIQSGGDDQEHKFRWVLRSTKMPVETSSELPIAAFRSVGYVEALDLAERDVRMQKKRRQRRAKAAKYAAVLKSNYD